MKHLATTTLMVLLILAAVTSFAQEHPQNRASPAKPALFTQFPDVINCTAGQLNSFFNSRPGENIAVSFNSNLMLDGNVKSNISKYSNLQTVVVKLAQFNNISFTISRIIDEDNQIVYSGHLFDPAYADGFELKNKGGGNYQFVKIELQKMLPTCSQ
ncbi:hypothetical protein QWZ08_18800 [Ferruginibacter paludis]|uniref:hypothetical protein n=1 Tax=Ferruginibacter paludis TaxID=1310417 RepID=UPI0025B37B9F|nr:hypothetical protein [Ferruginibacter paludis]MDN3657709.1 hypothetical protein [Ferruginibacter paludis]